MTYNIKGVEIFSAGTWNGDAYTNEDLNEMVHAFTETKMGVQPYVKIGHDKNQDLIKDEKDFPQRDGKPAAGWIDRLYVNGDKLLADFSEVPKKIYELIEKKAYKKVSSEIFWNVKINNKFYKKMLGAVALLGANTPGVMNLNDILSMYAIEIGDGELKLYDKDLNLETNIKGDKNMELEQVKKEYTEKLNAQAELLKAVKEEADTQKAQSETLKSELETLKEFKVQAEARQIELEKEAKAAKNEKFISEIQAELKVSPSMKPYIMELLGDTKKEYSFGDKKLTKEELIKETLKLYGAALEVNLEEGSSKDYSTENVDKDKEMDKAAKEFAKEKGVSYGTALKEVMKNK